MISILSVLALWQIQRDDVPAQIYMTVLSNKAEIVLKVN